MFRGGSSFRKFSKKKFSKFQKCPKVFPKVSKRVLNMFWGKFFEKFYAQCSMEGRVFEIFLKNQNFLKIQKCPKSFPQVSKHVLNMFWGKLFDKFLPSFPWNVESSKIFKKIYFQNSKNAQKCSQNYPNVFYCDFFEKKIYARCSMEGRVFENFQTFFFKILKMPKIVPKSIQKCFERVLGQIFRNIFLPSVPWRVEFSKVFKKNILKIPKMPKSVPKSIQTCFRVIFSKKVYARCSLEGRVFKNFKFFFFQNSKNAQNCSQKYPKVF